MFARSAASGTGAVRACGAAGVGVGAFEVLEGRFLLSGVVSLAGGVLTLQGNPSAENSLTAEYVASGDRVLAAAAGQVKYFPRADVTALRIVGGSMRDRVYVNPKIVAPATIDTLGGNDNILAGGGNDTIDAGPGNDFVHGYGGNDTVDAGDGDDSVYTDAGNDRLAGGAGADFLSGGDGNDQLTGGDGDDVLHGDDGDDALWGQAGNDTLRGWTGGDTVAGGAGDDYVAGDAGADRVDGGAGSDTLSGVTGEDRVLSLGDGPESSPSGADGASDGGDDSSTPPPPPSSVVDPQSPSSSPKVSLSGGVLTLAGSGSAGNKLTVEYFASGNRVLASVNDNVAQYFSKGSISSIRITGGSGADRVYVNPALTVPATVDTYGGNDSVLTGNGPDTVRAGDGNDTVKGYGGNDDLRGEGGDDNVSGNDGNDTIDTGAGNDTAFGGNGDDTILGGDGKDQLNGDAGNDDVQGGLGDDNLSGGDGADRLAGNDGNDVLTGNAGADTLDGGAGADLLSGRTSDDKVIGVVDGGVVLPPPVNSGGGGSTGGSSSGGGGDDTPTPVPPPAGDQTATVRAATADSSGLRASFKLIGTSGVASHPVHVNGLLTALGKGTPLTARYDWDFGDPNGRYNTLTGWNAAHMYDRAGTYKVTLTVTNEAGRRSSVSTTVTVTADTRRTIYVDASAGSDANNGSSPSKAVRTVDRANALLNATRNNVRVLFKRGQTFNADTYLSVNGTNVTIGAYGSGAKPVLRRVEGYDTAIVFTHDSADHVVVENLTFDSKYAPVGNVADHVKATAIFVHGRNVAVRGNTFLNLNDAVNSNGYPTGLLVQDNDAPLATGLRGYFVWGQGSDHVYLGNTVANSTREHVVRTWTMDRVLVAYNTFSNVDRSKVDRLDIANGTIEIQAGSYAYVAHNTANAGQVRVGPRGDQWEPTSVTQSWSVFEDNRINGVHAKIYPNAVHSVWRNNVIRKDAGEAFSITPSDGQGRAIADVNLLNNTVIDNAPEGQFLLVVAGRAPGSITLRNNLWVAPNIVPGGGNGVAGVFVYGSDLGVFKSIGGNVWPSPKSYHGYAPGGIHYVWPKWSDARGYLDAGEWEAQAVVSGDVFSNVAVDSNYRPTSGSAGAVKAAAGVLYDFYGHARSITGTVTAGAVQV